MRTYPNCHFPAIRFLLLSIALAATLEAETAFQFLTSDSTKTDKLDVVSIYGVEITTESDGPRFQFHRTCSIHGLRQDSFTYTTEQFSGGLPQKEWEAFQMEIRKYPIEKLKEVKGDGATSGSVILDGRYHDISAGPQSEARKQWQAFLDAFVHKQQADWSLGKITRTIEGETIKPVELTVAEILKAPEKFDGKRVRLIAYRHSEQECDHFVSSAADAKDPKRGIWFYGTSSFFKPQDSIYKNEGMVEVEGTFSTEPGAHGHMGIWIGGLTLVTSMQPVPDPEKTPPHKGKGPMKDQLPARKSKDGLR